MKDVAGKIAFVTGGASGIGLGIAGVFVDAGMKVVLADLRQDHIDEALAGFEQRGQSRSVHAIRVDVTDRAAMGAAAAETERKFGKVHVLVNNAGVGIQGPFKGITYEDWDFGLAVNLGGVVNGLQTFLPRIRAHGEGGHIVSTASLAALVPMPASSLVLQPPPRRRSSRSRKPFARNSWRGEHRGHGLVSRASSHEHRRAREEPAGEIRRRRRVPRHGAGGRHQGAVPEHDGAGRGRRARAERDPQ